MPRRNQRRITPRHQVLSPVERLECRVVPATFVVDTVADTIAADGKVSFREAITDANAAAGADEIDFNIPGFAAGDAVTIAILSALPDVTDTVVINGLSQPFADPSIANFFAPIELDGTAAGDADGLRLVDHTGSSVIGLSIFAFSKSGVAILGGGEHTLDQSGIGIDSAGKASPNLGDGVFIDADSNGNLIGSTVESTPANFVGNTISSNAGNGVRIDGDNNTVAANFIGAIDPADLTLGNGANGVLINGDNNSVFGFFTADSEQVISGNFGDGVQIAGDNNLVRTNFIGTDQAGKVAIPNGGNGVTVLAGATGNVIGSVTGGLGNVVSGNTGNGVAIAGDFNSVLGNYIGTDAVAGAALGNGLNGVFVSGSGNSVFGVFSSPGDEQVISGNKGDGVQITGSNNLIRANFIGTDKTGKVAIPNGGNGVRIGDTATANIVGAVSGGLGNVVSGNGGNGVQIDGNVNSVLGNYIGTDGVAGAALGNGANGVLINGNSNQVVGVFGVPGDEQVISGNKGDGVQIAGSSNTVLANDIGTDKTGNIAIPNGGDGVNVLVGALGNTIGSLSFEGNSIAGNTGNGVRLSGNSTTVQGNFIGVAADGKTAVPNGGDGVLVEGDNNFVIGSSDKNATQTISGNTGAGVRVTGDNNFVITNRVGVASTTADPVANGDGNVVITGTGNQSIGNVTGGAKQTLPTTFAAGQDTGGTTVARAFDKTGTEEFTYDGGAAFAGGVRVARADLTGDGIDDLVVGNGPGSVTEVRVIDGKTQAVLFTVQPFESSFIGGVYVAAGDVTGDGIADLIITPDQGGGPRVEVFQGGATFTQIANYFGIADPAFRGGARAAAGDVNGDGVGDLVVAAAFRGGPRVAVWDGTSLVNGAFTEKIIPDFFAFESTVRNGVFVSVGDTNGDGFADVIAGGAVGSAPRVRVLSGQALVAGQQTSLADFIAGDEATRGGARVAAKDLNGDAFADVLVANGPETAPTPVSAYFGENLTPTGTPPVGDTFDVFPGFSGGIFVG